MLVSGISPKRGRPKMVSLFLLGRTPPILFPINVLTREDLTPWCSSARDDGPQVWRVRRLPNQQDVELMSRYFPAGTTFQGGIMMPIHARMVEPLASTFFGPEDDAGRKLVLRTVRKILSRLWI